MNTCTQLEPVESVAIETSSRVISPRADVYETAENLVVIADLPGIDESNIDITIEKNILTLRASIKCESPPSHKLTYSEYCVADFERRFALPNEIDRDSISASLKNGVLRLVLPKSINAKVKKIAVMAD